MCVVQRSANLVCVGGRLSYIFWDFPLSGSLLSRISPLTFQLLWQPQNTSSNITSKTVVSPLSGPRTDFGMLWVKSLKLANISWCNSHHSREDSLSVLPALEEIYTYTHIHIYCMCITYRYMSLCKYIYIKYIYILYIYNMYILYIYTQYVYTINI